MHNHPPTHAHTLTLTQDSASIQPNLHLCYPPVLSLLQDHEPPFRLLGLHLLEHLFLRHAAPTDARRMGLAPLVFESLLSICHLQDQDRLFAMGRGVGVALYAPRTLPPRERDGMLILSLGIGTTTLTTWETQAPGSSWSGWT
jgi:hypothetical protein